jgi:hypothetical protein
MWSWSSLRAELLVPDMQSEQQHGEGRSDGQRRFITEVTEPPNQQRQAGATQEAVDRSDRSTALRMSEIISYRSGLSL